MRLIRSIAVYIVADILYSESGGGVPMIDAMLWVDWWLPGGER